jgi:cytoskeletal protein CcmA (bactofilin family)
MHYRSRWIFVLWLPALTAAQEANEVIIKQEPVAEDLYLAGGRVQVLGEVGGDVVAAGGTISIERQVKQDVIAAGGSIAIRAPVLDDVRAAGGEVMLSGEIGGDAVVAGGHVSLIEGSAVRGRAWLAGGDVEIAGTVGRGLRVAAGTVTIAGQIQADADLTAGRVVLLPTARIAGDLTYRSPQEATIHAGAQIGGKIHYVPVRPPEGLARPEAYAITVFWILSLLVTGIALYLLMPRFTVSAARTITSDPLKSLGLGLAWLVTAPVAAILLMATVLGIPLGLSVFALYFVSLLAGFLVGAFFLGDIVFYPLRRRAELSTGWRILSLVLGLVLVAALATIPVAGGLLVLLVLLLGLGAWILRAYRARSVEQVPPPVTVA